MMFSRKIGKFFIDRLVAGIKCRQKHYDVIIVGGGVMGSSTAYFLKTKEPSINVAVIEKDSTYSVASSTLSVSSIRQQFSSIENIKLSQWSYKFMSTIHNLLAIPGVDTPNIQLWKSSYMFLASQNGVGILENNCRTQRNCGADIEFLSAKQLHERFSWINTDGLAAGTICNDKGEGWFDGWSLLSSFRKKGESLGVEYIDEECISLDVNSTVKGVTVTNSEDRTDLQCSSLVNAAGPWAGHLMDTIGVNLPVTPRKRYVFVIDCPKGPPRSMPLMVDPTGVYCRPDGRGTLFLCGLNPTEELEPDASNLDVDYDYFYSLVWPILAERCPAMEELKLRHSWSGYYDYNTFDQNGIIGSHPEINNLYFANGFSGHGIQQSPAVGNAISELIIDGKFTAIDLTRLGYERILKNSPVKEINVV